MAATTLAEAIGQSNQIRPSTVFTTADPAQAVNLRTESDNPHATVEAVSIPAVLQQTVERFPEVVALRYKNDGEDAWQSVTFRCVIETFSKHKHFLKCVETVFVSDNTR